MTTTTLQDQLYEITANARQYVHTARNFNQMSRVGPPRKPLPFLQRIMCQRSIM
jgi:hypothetical protein